MATELLLQGGEAGIRDACVAPPQPMFSFNRDAIWNGVAANAARGPGGPGTLSRWADLLLRARNEGFD